MSTVQKVAPVITPELANWLKKQEEKQDKQQVVTPNIAKTNFALRENVASFVAHFGVEHCGFLTLTFSDDVTDVREASKRFNSFRTNILSKHTLGYIGVYERTKRGRVHFHFVVAFSENIRKGTRFDKRLNMVVPTEFNFAQAKKGKYYNAPDSLRAIWATLREFLPKYGFGIQHRLVPVESEKGVSGYLAKYLVKGLAQRKPEDKGFRFVRSTIGKKAVVWRCVMSRFAWNSTNAKGFRAKMGRFLINHALLLEKKYLDKKGRWVRFSHDNYPELAKNCWGSKWGYFVSQWIDGYGLLLEAEKFNHQQQQEVIT